MLAYRRLPAEVRERARQARVSAVLVQEMARSQSDELPDAETAAAAPFGTSVG